MNSELLEALIEAGIPAISAERVANAVQEVAVGAGKRAAEREVQRLPASPEAKYETFIPGDEPEPADAPPEASLGVGGPAVFFAGVQVGGELAVNNLLVRNNAVVQNLLNANRGRLGDLVVPFHLEVGNNQCLVGAPAVFQRPVVLLQNGDFRGQNLFTGGVVIQGQAGQVNWNGQPCDPARVTVVTEALAQGDTLTLNPKEVLVLRDLGDQQAQKFKFAYTPDPKNVVVDMTTQEVTFLTSAVFDAENCTVNTETATGWVVTAVTKDDVADVTGDASVTPQ
jgi:hypothetical protein